MYDLNMNIHDPDMANKLTKDQLAVLRDKATEAPFSGKFLNNKDFGMYTCAACGSELFQSNTKFDSGSGWPSFYDVVSKGSVRLVKDDSYGMERTEAVCAKCGGHLGHLFEDAYDQPTGQRYCINSVSLSFAPKNAKE